MLKIKTRLIRFTRARRLHWPLLGLSLCGYAVLPMALAEPDSTTHSAAMVTNQPAALDWQVPPAFMLGMAAIAQGDNIAVNSAITDLGSNPLATYLQFRYLMDVAGQNVPAVTAFLQANPDYVFSQNLKARVLTRLNRQGKFAEYQAIEALAPELKSTPARSCQSWQAALETHTQTPSQISAAEQLWTQGRSQPDACDPVFSWLKANDHLTADLYRQRICATLIEGNTSLADYLVREAKKQKIAGLDSMAAEWKAARNDPQQVLQAKLTHQSPEGDGDHQHALWQQAFLWLARSDPQAAHDLWASNPAHWGLNADTQAKIERLIALKAAYARTPQAYDWLMALPATAQDQETQTWAARAALRAEDWPKLKTAIAAMPIDLAQTPEWQYWWARADAELGDHSGAQARWQALTLTPDYYGFLAADRLGVAYHWPKIPPLPVLDTTTVLQNAMVQLAFYLRAAGLPDDARRAFSAALDALPPEEIPALTVLAEQSGWHDRVSIAIARMKKQDDPMWFAARYPTPWQTIVDTQAQAQGVAPNWLYAVIRRESLFMSDVGSGAGAQGLMQLMPNTADWINRKADLGLSRMNLHDPETSITLGSAYLSYLNGRYDGQLPLAIAAYNAGPGRVKQWLPENRALPGDVWVDTILFDETRNYVRAVLSATLIYSWREAPQSVKGKTQASADRLLALLAPVAPLNSTEMPTTPRVDSVNVAASPGAENSPLSAGELATSTPVSASEPASAQATTQTAPLPTVVVSAESP
ncbi:MAG: lytic transglycosylase domain-containing protein [Halothiobacillus sp.]